MSAAEKRFKGTPIRLVMLSEDKRQWRGVIGGGGKTSALFACHDGSDLVTAPFGGAERPPTADALAAFAARAAETVGAPCVGRLLRSRLPRDRAARRGAGGAEGPAAGGAGGAAAAAAAGGVSRGARRACLLSGACADPWSSPLEGRDLLPGGRVAGSSRMWLVLFCHPWRRACSDLVPTWLEAARKLRRAKVHIGTIDCAQHSDACRLAGQGLLASPSPPPLYDSSAGATYWTSGASGGAGGAFSSSSGQDLDGPRTPMVMLFSPGSGPGMPIGGAEPFRGALEPEALAAFAQARTRAARRQRKLSAIAVAPPAAAAAEEGPAESAGSVSGPAAGAAPDGSRDARHGNDSSSPLSGTSCGDNSTSEKEGSSCCLSQQHHPLLPPLQQQSGVVAGGCGCGRQGAAAAGPGGAANSSGGWWGGVSVGVWRAKADTGARRRGDGGSGGADAHGGGGGSFPLVLRPSTAMQLFNAAQAAALAAPQKQQQQQEQQQEQEQVQVLTAIHVSCRHPHWPMPWWAVQPITDTCFNQPLHHAPRRPAPRARGVPCWRPHAAAGAAGAAPGAGNGTSAPAGAPAAAALAVAAPLAAGARRRGGVKRQQLPPGRKEVLPVQITLDAVHLKVYAFVVLVCWAAVASLAAAARARAPGAPPAVAPPVPALRAAAAAAPPSVALLLRRLRPAAAALRVAGHAFSATAWELLTWLAAAAASPDFGMDLDASLADGRASPRRHRGDAGEGVALDDVRDEEVVVCGRLAHWLWRRLLPGGAVGAAAAAAAAAGAQQRNELRREYQQQLQSQRRRQDQQQRARAQLQRDNEQLVRLAEQAHEDRQKARHALRRLEASAQQQARTAGEQFAALSIQATAASGAAGAARGVARGAAAQARAAAELSTSAAEAAAALAAEQRALRAALLQLCDALQPAAAGAPEDAAAAPPSPHSSTSPPLAPLGEPAPLPLAAAVSALRREVQLRSDAAADALADALLAASAAPAGPAPAGWDEASDGGESYCSGCAASLTIPLTPVRRGGCWSGDGSGAGAGAASDGDGSGGTASGSDGDLGDGFSFASVSLGSRDDDTASDGDGAASGSATGSEAGGSDGSASEGEGRGGGEEVDEEQQREGGAWGAAAALPVSGPFVAVADSETSEEQESSEGWVEVPMGPPGAVGHTTR